MDATPSAPGAQRDLTNTPKNPADEPSSGNVNKPEKISYASLPKKTQLAILCLARLADPLVATSTTSYLFYQLKWFNPTFSDAKIASQAGLLVSAKTASQVLTGIFWGRLSDSSNGGRKLVLIIGLASQGLSMIGYGFARSFTVAVLWSIFGGIMSSNVAIVRCVVAELNPEKKYRARALLLLPLFANAGQLLGPLLGGLLSSNTVSDDNTQSDGFPYALPSLVIGIYHFFVVLLVLIFLEETLPTYTGGRNVFLSLWNTLRRLITSRRAAEYDYETVQTEEPDSPMSDLGVSPVSPPPSASTSAPPPAPFNMPKTSFLQIWTINVFCTMLAHFIISGHVATFGTVWTVFLSTPVVSREGYDNPNRTPLAFSGGVGLHPREIGILASLAAGFGLVAQMSIYPKLNDRFSTVRIWRTALFIFPIAYIIAPLPSLVASVTNSVTTTSPAVWAMIATVLIIFTAGRTGVVPATTLLINDCVPAPDARGTINTVGTVVANLSRTVFPFMALSIYGWGLEVGVVGLGFWFLAVVALLSIVASRWVRELDNGKEVGRGSR